MIQFFKDKFELLLRKTEKSTPSLRDQVYRIQRFYAIVGLRFLPVDMPIPQRLLGYFFVILACMVPFFTLYFFIFKDVDLVARVPAVTGFMVACQSVVKSVHMMVFRKKFARLSMDMIDESEENLRNRDRPEFIMGTRNHTFVNRFLLVLAVCYMTACTQISFFPYMTRQPFMLPVSYEIPGIDHRSHPGYEINYSYIVVQAFHAAVVVVTYDSLFILFVIHCVTKLEVFTHYAEFIGDFSHPFYDSLEKQRSLIMKCCKMHIHALEFLRTLSDLYVEHGIFNIVAGTLVICASMIHIKLTPISNTYLLLQASLVQLFIMCFMGQMVTDSIEDASDAIYMSKWYQIKDAKLRKMILFMSINSTNMGGLSAGGMLSLNYETYAAILKNTYSFFAFISNTMGF